MTKVNRTLNPTFSSYKDTIVGDSLKKDFLKKCYLCEEVTRHYEVEHFYPQVSHTHLVNEYSNLFYSCQKCNKIKPKTTNTLAENEILNCCDIDVEKYIKLKLNINECKVEIQQILNDDELNAKIKNTIEVLQRVYNGKNSKSNSCEDLKDEIKIEIENFRKKIDKYEKTKLKRVIELEIQEGLALGSTYSTFKRWIIRDNDKLKIKFEQYIGV